MTASKLPRLIPARSPTRRPPLALDPPPSDNLIRLTLSLSPIVVVKTACYDDVSVRMTQFLHEYSRAELDCALDEATDMMGVPATDDDRATTWGGMGAVEDDGPDSCDRCVGRVVDVAVAASLDEFRDVDAAGKRRKEGSDVVEPGTGRTAELTPGREEVEDEDVVAAVNRTGSRLRTWPMMSPGTVSRRVTLYSIKLRPS